jgi:Domain of unknown function (DUF6438)/Ankyrin repeats (3 copies)
MSYAQVMRLAFCAVALADAADSIKISRDEASRNLISSIPIIRTAESPRSPFRSIQVDLVIDTNGDVRSAEAPKQSLEPDLAQFISRATDLAKALKYRPFLRERVPIEVHTEEYVRILPPEKTPTTHVPFPVVDNLSTLEFSLKRTTCFSSCPHYDIRITGNGIVKYTGHDHVAVGGEHNDRVAPEEVQLLLDALRNADFFSLSDKYVMNVSDNPTFVVGIKIATASKTITDYAGLQVGMPLAITDLEKQLDAAAGSTKWVEGNGETVPSLRREGFDFKSKPAGSILTRVALSGDEMVVRDLIDTGTSITILDPFGNSALANAAASAKPAAVDLLIQYGADAKNPRVLTNAASSGSPSVVRRVLDAGADATAVGPDGGAPLFSVVSRGGGNAKDLNRGAVVRLLLNAGAGPNVRDKGGNIPLHASQLDEDSARALLDAGAHVNALNNDGETPLMTVFSERTLEILLAAGADISIRSRAGKTALDRARERHFSRIADLLEKAAK